MTIKIGAKKRTQTKVLRARDVKFEFSCPPPDTAVLGLTDMCVCGHNRAMHLHADQLCHGSDVFDPAKRCVCLRFRSKEARRVEPGVAVQQLPYLPVEFLNSGIVTADEFRKQFLLDYGSPVLDPNQYQIKLTGVEPYVNEIQGKVVVGVDAGMPEDQPVMVTMKHDAATGMFHVLDQAVLKKIKP